MQQHNYSADAREREREQLKKWHYRVSLDQRAHSEAGLFYTRRSRWLGSASALLSAVVGTSVFASLSNIQLPGSGEVWVGLLVGLLAALAAGLAALQTFLGDATLAAKHRAADTEYGCVRREIEEVQTKDHSVSISGELDHIRKSIDRIARNAPEPRESAWKKAHAEIDKVEVTQ